MDLPVYDTQCGAKMFRVTPELAQVLNQPFQSSWIFDVELLARLVQHGRRQAPDFPHYFISELPLKQWDEVAGSKLKVRDYFRAIRELWLIFKGTLMIVGCIKRRIYTVFIDSIKNIINKRISGNVRIWTLQKIYEERRNFITESRIGIETINKT